MAIVLVLRHMGKGPHPSGSPQSVHGKGDLSVHEDKAQYGGPTGEKLSGSFVYGPKSKVGLVTKDVLEAIDSVHGVTHNLEEPIPIKSVTTKARSGCLKFKSYRGNNSKLVGQFVPLEIDISASPRPLPLTVAHEIGHLLDRMMITLPGEGPENGGYASSGWPILEEWRKAVAGSDAIAQLRKAYTSGRDPYEDRPIFDLAYFRGAMSQNEIFARSYSQYIAKKSGNKAMMDELNTKRECNFVDRHVFWTDEDFEPVATAFDNLFKKLGWQK